MKDKILQSDRGDLPPAKEQVITPQPPPPPEPEQPTIDLLDFDKPGQVATGMYAGKDENGHLFRANGKEFYLSADSTMRTVNEALESVTANSVLIKVEYLGEHDTESRKLFEVSQIG